MPAILNSAAKRNDLTTARLKSTRLANSWNLAGKVLCRCLLAVNTLSPCFEVFRVKSEALCVLTVRLQQRSYTLHCLQPPNVNKLRLCSIALTIVLNISQACASLSAEIWGLIIVLKWRMAERKRISLRDHWSHFGLWCLKLSFFICCTPLTVQLGSETVRSMRIAFSRHVQPPLLSLFRQSRIITLARCIHNRTYNKRKSLYDVLDVPHTATQDEIKTAYYELSLKYHPDVNKSEKSEHKFQGLLCL